MKYDLIIRPEAEQDLKQAFLWYENQKTGIGEDFLVCIDEAFGRIQNNPYQYPLIYNEIRRCLICRFPYGIFYIIHQETISVLSVFHLHRNPKTWKERI